MARAREVGGSHPLLRGGFDRTRRDLLLVICAGVGVLWVSEAGRRVSMTRVFVVRHAEKGTGNDPGLSERGRARAAALAQRMAAEPLAAIYATEYRRTQQTVAPAAQTRALEVQVVSGKRVDRLAETLLDTHAGATTLVAGHSNTVPELLARLGVREEVELAEDEYGDLFVVEISDGGQPSLGRERFGD